MKAEVFIVMLELINPKEIITISTRWTRWWRSALQENILLGIIDKC
jgi:hypothetical protein